MPVLPGILGHGYNPRGYHEQKAVRDRVVPYLVEEAPHIAATVAVNLAARNPWVWAGTVIAHAGYHLYSKFHSGSSSSPYQQNGGPGTNSNYKASRNSRTVAARRVSAHGGRRKGAKPRKRCPVGYRWNGRRCVKAEWLEYVEFTNFAIGAYRAYRDR